MELELAAVTVPSALKAGRKVGIFSMLAVFGCSSSVTVMSPDRVLTTTGTVSAVRLPFSMAVLARLKDWMAKASMSSRLIWYLLAMSWAKEPIRRPVLASSRPSVNMQSWTSPWPIRMPPRALGSRNGALLILSIPPATIISLVPALIRSWASMVAFMPEPQSLLMVVAPVSTGMPAAMAAWRAGPWRNPEASTQPMMTSLISSPLSPARLTAALMAALPRLTAVRLDRLPWKPPMGVRTPAAINTSFIIRLCFGRLLSLRG